MTKTHERLNDTGIVAPKKILVVDDNEQIVGLIERILAREGFEIIKVTNPDDAMAWFTENGVPDLMLSDVKMPGMSGPELSRQLKELHGDFAVLFMSGYPGENDSNATPLLNKPFNRAELVAAINAVL